MHASVDDSLLYRLQAFLSADDQLTKGQDEIRLQGNRVILWRVLSRVFVTFFRGF